jgi:hypothetical protein
VDDDKPYKYLKANFPLFDDEKSDPFIFMKAFEDALRLTSAPRRLWNLLLKQSVADSTTQSWIEEKTNLHWAGKTGMRTSFIKRVKLPDYDMKLKEKLARLRNYNLKDLHEYFKNYIEYSYKLGYDVTNKKVISDCEYGLCDDVKRALQQYRYTHLVHHDDDETHEFKSLYDLQRVSVWVLRHSVIERSSSRYSSSSSSASSHSDGKSKRFIPRKKSSNSDSRKRFTSKVRQVGGKTSQRTSSTSLSNKNRSYSAKEVEKIAHVAAARAVEEAMRGRSGKAKARQVSDGARDGGRNAAPSNFKPREANFSEGNHYLLQTGCHDL